MASKAPAGSAAEQHRQMDERVLAVARRHAAEHGATQADLTKSSELRAVPLEALVQSLNRLLRAERLVAVRGGAAGAAAPPTSSSSSSTVVRYRLPTAADARTRGLGNEERMVLQRVREGGNAGVWTKDLRQRTNLSQPQVARILKALEARGLVKAVKGVAHPSRKLFMLAELEPSREITGGAWYINNEFDEDFIAQLRLVCLKYVGGLPQGSAGASVADVAAFVRASGVFGVELQPEDVAVVLDTLYYDNLLDKLTAEEAQAEARARGLPLLQLEEEEEEEEEGGERGGHNKGGGGKRGRPRGGAAAAIVTTSSSSEEEEEEEVEVEEESGPEEEEHESGGTSESDEDEAGARGSRGKKRGRGGAGAVGAGAGRGRGRGGRGSAAAAAKERSKRAKRRVSSSSGGGSLSDEEEEEEEEEEPPPRRRAGRAAAAADDDDSGPSCSETLGSDSADDGDDDDDDDAEGGGGGRGGARKASRAAATARGPPPGAGSASNGAAARYRLAAHPLPPVADSALLATPCGSCPVSGECREGAQVAPQSCAYLRDWLLEF
jgi:DNA-binding Lrp family transcriptional regulator